MAKKKENKEKLKLLPYLLSILVFIGLISYLVVKPFMNWKTYTIDDFISFSYPSDWHFQTDNYLALSGNEELFLISDYDGELSRQDFSSVDQVFLVDGNRESKTKVKSLDEYVKPVLGFCDSTDCILSESKSMKNGFNIDKIMIKGNKKTFYKGEHFYFIEGKDYFYEISVGFVDARGDFGNFLRQKTIDKIIDSIVINDK